MVLQYDDLASTSCALALSPCELQRRVMLKGKAKLAAGGDASKPRSLGEEHRRIACTIACSLAGGRGVGRTVSRAKCQLSREILARALWSSGRSGSFAGRPTSQKYSSTRLSSSASSTMSNSMPSVSCLDRESLGIEQAQKSQLLSPRPPEKTRFCLVLTW